MAMTTMRSLTPRVDVYETEDAFMIEADMPGVAPDQAEVEVHEDRLTLSGHRTNGAVSDGARLRERAPGDFRREFRIGDGIDSEQIAAKLADGVLRVTLPKSAKRQRRVVQVN